MMTKKKTPRVEPHTEPTMLDEEEEVTPDYARGKREKPASKEHPDFARGIRDEPMRDAHPDFARGKRATPAPDDESDYARGLRHDRGLREEDEEED
jgi:hypothetical protein